MGTNYYAVINSKELNDIVNEFDLTTRSYTPNQETPWITGRTVHIGKKSYGWDFHFHGNRKSPLDSAAAWIDMLLVHKITILDEYGDSISLEDFKDIVYKRTDSDGDRLKSVYVDAFERPNVYSKYLKLMFLDGEAYTFSETYFS